MSSGHIVRVCVYRDAVSVTSELRSRCGIPTATHTGHVGRDSGLGSVGRGPCFRLSRQDAVELYRFQALFIDFSFVFVVCERPARARARRRSRIRIVCVSATSKTRSRPCVRWRRARVDPLAAATTIRFRASDGNQTTFAHPYQASFLQCTTAEGDGWPLSRPCAHAAVHVNTPWDQVINFAA